MEHPNDIDRRLDTLDRRVTALIERLQVSTDGAENWSGGTLRYRKAFNLHYMVAYAQNQLTGPNQIRWEQNNDEGAYLLKATSDLMDQLRDLGECQPLKISNRATTFTQ